MYSSDVIVRKITYVHDCGGPLIVYVSRHPHRLKITATNDCKYTVILTNVYRRCVRYHYNGRRDPTHVAYTTGSGRPYNFAKRGQAERDH